jgi:hypothetical protein
MTRRALVFAPCAYNLAETTRMLQIAKGVRDVDRRGNAFDVRFMSEGGEFEALIEQAGFPVEPMRPRITPEKIEYAYKVDKGEALGAVFSTEEIIEKIDGELDWLRAVQPVAIVTGSYVTVPVTHRILDVPLVWVVQSTWLEDFFTSGAGMTTDLRPAFVKRIADFGIFELLNLWMRVGLLHPLNKAAKHYGVAGFDTMFEYWRGDLNLVAEPPDLTGAELPDDYHFIGPVIARQDFPIPRAVLDLPHDLPLVYFAMGSSGTPEIVARVVEGFADQPYQVVAPVRSMLGHVDDVHVPDNVLVTDWLPALEVNRMADISVIHGGIGTVMTAALAGKPIVGVGMQPEQTANLAAIARHGFAIRVPKSTDPSDQILEAARRLLADDDAKRAARDYAESLAQWNGPANAARLLVDSYGTA